MEVQTLEIPMRLWRVVHEGLGRITPKAQGPRFARPFNFDLPFCLAVFRRGVKCWLYLRFERLLYIDECIADERCKRRWTSINPDTPSTHIPLGGRLSRTLVQSNSNQTPPLCLAMVRALLDAITFHLLDLLARFRCPMYISSP